MKWIFRVWGYRRCQKIFGKHTRSDFSSWYCWEVPWWQVLRFKLSCRTTGGLRSRKHN